MARQPKKHHMRTIDRIHILIRLELANPLLSSTQHAQLAGLSIHRFSVLKSSPLYIKIHNQYMTGVIGQLDTRISDNYNLSLETLNFAVPVAMQALLKQALQEKDLRVQNKACNDLLDRHGKFAKVTRVGLATSEQGGVANEKDNKVAAELVAALENIQKNKNNRETEEGETQAPPTIDSPAITEQTQ